MNIAEAILALRRKDMLIAQNAGIIIHVKFTEAVIMRDNAI
jgi:hypothetical protein